MQGAAATIRHEMIGLAGVIERNVYLIKRYIWWDVAFFIWTVANTLTIVFIAKGIPSLTPAEVNQLTTVLLIGAVIWAYLGIIFEIVTETVAWERWEGTIEYTFMAPLSRPVHLFGMGLFSIVYGVIRAVLLFGVVALFFNLDLPDANYVAALVVLMIASISFIGIGMMTAVLPADLAGEGDAARLRRPGHPAGRLGRLLPDQRPAGVDAVDREDLAGDLRARRGAAVDPAREGAQRPLARHLAADGDRGRRRPAGAGRLPRAASGTPRSTGS